MGRTSWACNFTVGMGSRLPRDFRGPEWRPLYPGHLSVSPVPFLSSPHHRLSLSSPRATMSTAPSTPTSRLDFVSIFNAALESYKRKTNNGLASHPLLPRLQSCVSPKDILTILREQIPASDRSQNINNGLTKWVIQTVSALCAYSDWLQVGQAVELVKIGRILRDNSCSNAHVQAFPPAIVIFAGIHVLSVGVLHDSPLLRNLV